jgi:hypothetical protein
VKWRGKSTQGLDAAFKAKVAAAAQAAGASYIYVISGKRTPETNTGVSNSNHLYGHAIDGYAVVRGKKVPLGTLLRDTASDYGLRSGDVAGFYKGAPDPNHVDDGYNVNHGPLPAQTQPTQTQTQDQSVPDQAAQTQADMTSYALQAQIASIPQLPGPEVVTPALAGDQGQQGARPLTPYAETWRMIAGNGNVSPETLRLAELAGYGDGSTSG